MTIHGLREEFQPSSPTKEAAKAPEVIKPTTGEHEGIASVNTSAITGLGQSVDIKG